MRYNDFLQRFNFVLTWRPESACERLGTLSRRDQDKSSGVNDERTAGRILQLLPSVRVHPTNITQTRDNPTPHEDPAARASLFESDEM